MRTCLLLLALLFISAPVHAFSEAPWPHYDLITGFYMIVFTGGDLDQDGRDDILTQTSADVLMWYRSGGGGTFTTNAIHLTYPVPNAFAQDITIADVNGDGEMDIVISYNNELVLYINDGNEQFTALSVHNNPVKRKNVVVDLDGDGDMDIVVGESSGVICYENDGDLNFTRHVLSEVETLVRPVVGDVDSDGDLDVYVTSSETPSQLYYLDNQGALTFSSTTFLLHGMNPEKSIAGYQDGSSFNLVLGAAVHGQGSGIFRLSRNGFAWEFELLYEDKMPRYMISTDFNNDGSPDILCATRSELAWFPLDHPDEDQFIVITNVTNLLGCPALADFDADGDVDIVFRVHGGGGTDRFKWFINPDYRTGYDLRIELNDDGIAHLTWNPLDGDGFEVRRNGEVIATTADPEYDDLLPDYGKYEYTVSTGPQSECPKPSYPRSVHYPDPLHIRFLEEFEQGFPGSWVIEDFIATEPWDTSWRYQEDGMLPGRHPIVGFEHPQDSPRNPMHIFGRLVSPLIHLEPGDREVFLTFDHALRAADNATSLAAIEILVNSEWTRICGSLEETSLRQIELTDYLSGASSFKIGFNCHSRRTLYAWSIDNVTITAVPPPAYLAFTPTHSLIPPSGGQVVFNGQLQSTIDHTFHGVCYWRQVQFPDGGIHTFPVNAIFSLPGRSQIDVQGMTLNVPPGAPGGAYTFTGFVGYPNHPVFQISDSFNFTKFGAGVDGYVFDPADWGITGGFAQDHAAVAVEIPSSFALSQPYPNPFNPVTSLNVSLPASSQLTVVVYDLTGREVSTLSNGVYSPGQHRLTFDGSNLSSGIYFVQANVPGQLNEVRKLVLIK